MNAQNLLRNPNTNWKYILIVVVLAFLASGGILGWQYWWLPKEEIGVQREGFPTDLKIGIYECEPKETPTTSWEELMLKDVRIVNSEEEIFPTPPERKIEGEWWIEKVRIQDDIAYVYFGGDEKIITERSGSAGAYCTTGGIVFALTEDPRIQRVYLGFKEPGSHAEPGFFSRYNFISIWPKEILEAIAEKDPSVKEILIWRYGP